MQRSRGRGGLIAPALVFTFCRGARHAAAPRGAAGNLQVVVITEALSHPRSIAAE
jgi:hypothetical protein